MAGGTSGSLMAWDHSGEQIFETVSHEDPICRLTDIFTVAEVSCTDEKLSGAFVIGGSNPVIHLVSNIGYPFKQVLLGNT